MLQNIATDILLHHQLRGINKLLYSAPFWQSGLFKGPRVNVDESCFGAKLYKITKVKRF